MEAHRRNMPYCMGSLIWQLNDVWPCASWSGIDYYGRWKAMHYFVRKACEPVVVSPYIQGDTLDIFVVSDLRKPLRGVMKLTLTDFSGNELKSSSHPVTVGAAASQRALRYGVRDYLDGADPGASTATLHQILIQGRSFIDRGCTVEDEPKMAEDLSAEKSKPAVSPP